jgi:CRP-like cAMP-binding protein
MIAFMYIVASPVNVLEITPLFFLGSTLIFIGYELLWEWLWEIRHQVFATEYCIVWFTFLAIQIVGIDAGIVIGVFVAIVEQVVLTAQTTAVNRINKRSRAVRGAEETKLLNHHAYNSTYPKIMTLEIVGTVFFGSSLQLLSSISEEVGLSTDDNITEAVPRSPRTPHTSSFLLAEKRKINIRQDSRVPYRWSPKYLVLDLSRISNLDASASRGCFYQLSKLCSKRDILVCAAGASQRVAWMLRSHSVSFPLEEEDTVKAKMQRRTHHSRKYELCEKILLFVTIQEALEFCENVLVHDLMPSSNRLSPKARFAEPDQQPLGMLIGKMIGANSMEEITLKKMDEQHYYEEICLSAGSVLFDKDSHADSFYIVLKGAVANEMNVSRNSLRDAVISGAGLVSSRVGSSSNLIDQDLLNETPMRSSSMASIWSAGGVFGYLDFLLMRPREYRSIATQADTRVARISQSHLDLLQEEDGELYILIQRCLLQASIVDLGNCTCHSV